MSDSNECVITFPIVGGIFGVSRLATKPNALRSAAQISRGTLVNGLTSSIPQSEHGSPPPLTARSPGCQ